MGLRNFINDMVATAKAEAKLHIKEQDLKGIRKEYYELEQKYKDLKRNTSSFLKYVMREIYGIKVDNNLNILEYDKKQRINNKTELLEKQCADFINKKELDRPENSI